MNSEVTIIIQARMTSSRLPGKVLIPFNKVPVLEHVVMRCRISRLASNIVVAAPRGQESAPIRDLCKKLDCDYIEGSESNVLERYYEAAKVFGSDVIVRITSDCPLIDPIIIDQAISYFHLSRRSKGIEYLSSAIESRMYPRGLDVEVFSMNALTRAHLEATDALDREHVTRFIYNKFERKLLASMNAPVDNSHFRLTLDTPEDLAMFTALFKEIGKQPEKQVFYHEILDILQDNPRISELNSFVEQAIS